MKPVTITLSKPIEHAGKEYKELTFTREAEVGDLIAAETQSGEFGRVAAALASISGVPFPAFKKLGITDMKAVMAKVGHLVGNEPALEATGEELPG